MLAFGEKANVKNSSGYSLIELIVTIVVTSIVIIIFYSIFAPNQKNSVTSVLQTKAAELGQAYLEEITLKRFDESSPAGNAVRCNQASAPPCGTIGAEEGAGNRALFDDVDDYDGVDDQPARDAFGNNRPGFNGFRVTVAVAYAGGDFGLAAQDLKRVTVTVFTPEGNSMTFSRYKGNF